MSQSDREILRPLVERLLELAADPIQEKRKELWARHQALQKTEKIPVCVTYGGIPAKQWEAVFGPKHLKCQETLAQQLEFDLKKRIWIVENCHDDYILWPYVWISAIAETRQDWGVPLEWKMPDEDLGAKQVIAPFAEGIDLSKLTRPNIIVNEEATRCRVEAASELLGGRLKPQVLYPTLGHRAFDYAVQMRGMDRLLMDVLDQPEPVHQLLEFITSAVEQHHRQREANGWINCAPDPSGRYQAVSSPWRVNVSFLAADFFQRKPCLADEWAYITDQTAAGLGPAQFGEFILPYHQRMAAPFTQQTVYFHGCETLDQKYPLIAKLPNLRRVHVSPWSSVRRAVEVFQGRVVMEVHAHPGNVFFAFTAEEMRAECKALIEGAQGMPMDLNLSDIHSLNGKPEILSIWTQIARELCWR